jgi:hypothetical protein
MIRIHICDYCEFCDGDAYIPAGEVENYTNGCYMRYEPCLKCNDVGRKTKWISLCEFADLMERAVSFEPDYQELAKQKPVSQFQDSRAATWASSLVLGTICHTRSGASVYKYNQVTRYG